jgi:hypothetical protein
MRKLANNDTKPILEDFQQKPGNQIARTNTKNFWSLHEDSDRRFL